MGTLRKLGWVGCILLMLVCLAACTSAPLTSIPTQTAIPATLPPPTPTVEPTPTPTLTPSPTPFVTDYSTLQEQLTTLAESRLATDGIDLGIAFVDLTSGARVTVRGDERFYSLSTFKAPLAVYYLWLVEQGQLAEQPGDVALIEPMLSRSSNTDTSCLLERVGGLAGFNDWLAAQGLPRQQNFVVAWQGWACPSHRAYS